MTPEYLPTTPQGRIWRLIEEMGEVAKEIGKAGRFGLDSRHPNGGPTNAEKLLAELDDLRHAAEAVEEDLLAHIDARAKERAAT